MTQSLALVLVHIIFFHQKSKSIFPVHGSPIAGKIHQRMGLFIGQSTEFFFTLKTIATEAEKARRQLENAEEERDDAY